jgi:YbgC/YbaW family acyl-CoA thioester hydrolase
MKPYTRTFSILIHHVDAAGIVFFANYFILAHDVYEAFLSDIGHGIPKAIDDGEYIIPIAHCEGTYHRPMRHGEAITAYLHLTELRSASFTIETGLVGADGILRATITTRHVCVNFATMRPMALPAALHAALAEYLKA